MATAPPVEVELAAPVAALAGVVAADVLPVAAAEPEAGPVCDAVGDAVRVLARAVAAEQNLTPAGRTLPVIYSQYARRELRG